MAKVYQLPTMNDRQLIHQAILHFAHDKCSRRAMMLQIEWILRRYQLRKLKINDFTVQLESAYGFTAVIIQGNQKSVNCPVCEMSSDRACYIRTRKENLIGGEDCITVTCLECGAIYDTMAPNGQQVEKGRG